MASTVADSFVVKGNLSHRTPIQLAPFRASGNSGESISPTKYPPQEHAVYVCNKEFQAIGVLLVSPLPSTQKKVIRMDMIFLSHFVKEQKVAPAPNKRASPSWSSSSITPSLYAEKGYTHGYDLFITLCERTKGCTCTQ